MVAIEQNLEDRGVIDRMEAMLRAEMFQSLGHRYDKLPAPSKETRTINELIREYLKYNGYHHSAGVFEVEAHLPKLAPERSQIAEELNIDDILFPKI